MLHLSYPSQNFQAQSTRMWVGMCTRKFLRSLKDPYGSRGKKGMILEKKADFCLLPSCSWEEVWIPNSFSFSPYSSVSQKPDLFFLTTTRGSPTACGSLLVSLYITIYICTYSKILRSLLRKEIYSGKGRYFPCKDNIKGRQGHVRALVFKKSLPTEISEGLCFQINCMLLSLASGHGIKTDEPTKQHRAAPASSHHQ